MSDAWILPKQLHTLVSALDTEALSLDCNEQSRICEQSLFVRSKPSPLRTWLQRWKRDSWTRHLSGRILRPSLGRAFEAAWISSLADTLANRSVQPDSAKAKTIQGISGRGLQMAFDFSSPSAASLKTSKDISAWGCPTSSKTWQEWVTERRGDYSQRLNAVRRTSGSGCSSWPTMGTTQSHISGQGSSTIEEIGKQQTFHLKHRTNRHGQVVARNGGKTHQATLASAVVGVQNWPSPVALEVRQGFQDRSRGMKGSQESLTTAVIKDNHGPHAPESSSMDGSRQELWATATVSTGAHRQKDGSMINKLDQQVQCKLNPRWVETLMGLPIGWTMPSCTSPVTIEPMNSGSSGME